jgi:2,5-diketo-D-gluconate reductase A
MEPFGHSQSMRRFAAEKGVVIHAYSPLTRTGRLGDRTHKNIAARYGRSPAQILIRWNLQQGSVPLPKANKKRH